MRKLLVNALNSIIRGEKNQSCQLYILAGGENQHWAVLGTKMFVYWEWSCVEFVSQCGNFVCKRAAGIVRTSKSLDPPALPRNSGCLAYSLWLGSLKRVHRGATGSEFPSYLLLQKKKRVWSSPLKTELNHKQTCYTHKIIAFLTTGIKNFKLAVFNQIQPNIF